jgi:cellobiose phosphorylase
MIQILINLARALQNRYKPLHTDDQTPLRAELFSVEQMEQHGKILAGQHVLGRFRRDRLLTRLDENEKELILTRSILSDVIKSRSRIAPAAEWLLDNFYLIEEQIRAARQHLPKNYSRELPRLAEGPSRGLPRVYELALAAIAHGDGRIDADSLARFIAAYQSVSSLTLGELWAIPIMLRLALIENLRRVGVRIAAARQHLNQAQEWADKMIDTAASDPKSLILVIADMARSNPPMLSPFVAELTRRLQGHGPALALALSWMELRLAESSLTIERLVLAENQQQAMDQVSISNSIGSLRLLGAQDWRVFVEGLSGVEQLLRQDPSGEYAAMDFATRDGYRHVVERLAKNSEHAEIAIAQAALKLAQDSAASLQDSPIERHVGYYLVDKGLPQLEANLQTRLSLFVRLQRASALLLLSVHIGAILVLSVCTTALLLALTDATALPRWQLWSLGLLTLLAGSQLSSALVNWLTTLFASPDLLPRMNYADGLPADRRTLVVVPTMLGSAGAIEDLLEDLEVRFLGNQDPHLHFGLLTDFTDANEEAQPGDALLLQQAQLGIERLNQKYAPGEATDSCGNTFFLLHRPRRWNAVEKHWMGYERKRGKLADLNALLRGDGEGRFSLLVGNIALLEGVRYVITLDTDTQLPRDSARQLIATMAHPLNQPRYGGKKHLVSGGFGILQPGIGASLAGNIRSRYAKLIGSEPGIDPYTRMVSDVYQDFFGEGSFIGKGIYDVDAFEFALRDRFPENRILSHDLLEGCYVRSGLVSDVRLYEEYPTTYAGDVSRQHRWIRGDWQIAHWLLPRVPGVHRTRESNPLSALSRWKIFDNLRRSLVPAALVLLLLLGWATGQHPWIWTVAVVANALLLPLVVALAALVGKNEQAPVSQHLRLVFHSAADNLMLNIFKLACLPYEAAFSVDAILRATWRMLVSQRGLLEWTVSGAEQTRSFAGARVELLATLRRMWTAPVIAVAAGMLLSRHQLEALPAALPLLALWFTAPLLAWWLSRPLRQVRTELKPAQVLFLHRIARKTWAFFERYVTEADNWLPPDNFQEHPGPILAHRTSPTNIGLALLANLNAWDFGYITAGTLLERTANTLQTMAELERHQGHFLNWYDTEQLQPLLPRYVSAVDSGNLAAHLLTLREGLLALPDQKIMSGRLLEGLADTAAIFVNELISAFNTPVPVEVQAAIDKLQAVSAQVPVMALANLPDVAQMLTAMISSLEELCVVAVINTDDDSNIEPGWWAEALAQQCRLALDDLQFLVPWLMLPKPPASLDNKTSAALAGQFEHIPTLRTLAALAVGPQPSVADIGTAGMSPQAKQWLLDYEKQLQLGAERAAARIATTEQLARQAAAFAVMEYEFLYDRGRHLLAIGYNVDEFRRDTAFYDLLASEARLCNFVAIAQGQLPQESWFALGRLLTTAGGEPLLVSWSGSMFEYLMPMLVMPSYDSTLLDATCRAAVARQIAYGKQRGVPWGISESGYNTVDAHLNYQYHAFGVPGLGLKRGLADELVIAPYASALALLVDPEAACLNLQRLSAAGIEGACGFYEAVDYTPARVSRGQLSVTVQSYMAHHQGMSLLALGHLLLDAPMQRRFAAAPQFQATLLLLQERIPVTSLFQNHAAEDRGDTVFPIPAEGPAHDPLDAHTPTPEVQLLSNGRYHVMLTNAGGGYSRWQDMAITRWREDTTRDNWGSFIYLSDVQSGEYWSAAHQPTLKQAASYEALFSEGRAEYRRRDNDIEAHTEIVVSPEDDVELRRLRVTNRSRVRRVLEITSYAEVVLAPPAADANQTAFGNLFVQTAILPARHAILCTRRPRSEHEKPPCMFHLLGVDANKADAISFETDRVRFIGRGLTLAAPQALASPGALSGSEGSVLDPVVAIRCRITLEPRQSLTLDFVSGVGASSEAAMALIERYQDRHIVDRAFDLAGTHSNITLRQINATESDSYDYRRLAGAILYASPALRADSALLRQNRRGQSGLWGYSISGDLPILLLKIASSAHIDLARQLIQCHAYWRLKGLVVDLVIWNEDHVGYRQVLQDQIMGLIATGTEAHSIDRPGGIFVRSAEQISLEDRILLQSVARAIISDHQGSLAEQLARRGPQERRVARLVPVRVHRPESAVLEMSLPADQQLHNGLGGYSIDGREYVITTLQTRTTPLPWVNILANPGFGSVISESGLAYTWSENAHEYRLSPWSDDAVGASGGEAFYLRDEETGHFWSPTPLPCRGAQPYVTRHGFGYSVFEHTTQGIRSELRMYVDLEQPVKFMVLKVRNNSGRIRRLSATGYVEWVLGDLRAKTAMHIVTEIDATSGALFARNAYNSEFTGRVAFFDVDDVSRTLTGDRSEFLGRNGTLAQPEALTRVQLSGRLGAGLDPCGAIQVPFELLDGQEREIIFRLGASHDHASTRELAQRLRIQGSARASLEKVQQYWDQTLGTIQIESPDIALNMLANGWLVYQVLACRLWARSGYYQSGGAFGFRDQLQDTMALVHTRPELTREHLLRSAARQYPEGDVQHWWHPPAGRGVRTRCSDDYLWLPLAVCRYVATTGNASVLDEKVSFLEGRLLNSDEESYYDLPRITGEQETLYHHCVLALMHGLRFGTHGLPLMGSGDWNDGMNLVGIHGKGESVWLGFFLHKVLIDFTEVALLHDDAQFAERCQAEAAQLRANLAKHAWDGGWYRRAWFDDGTPLGSAGNAECAIDSIAQSWSVLSGAGDPKRSQLALEALDQHLVHRDTGIIQLLDPPFDKSSLNPGYIKGYVPGVRENGGQYTHAAIWAAMAFAASGNRQRAWELLTLINPVNHGLDAETVAIYKTEPYVVAADVYAVAPHTGRGGWSWYTGSASWLYRLITEELLGLQRRGACLHLAPSMPEHWPGCMIHYRYLGSVYHITIARSAASATGKNSLIVDDIVQDELRIFLLDDHQEHIAVFTIAA